jgi:hypothetical protein
MEVEKFRNLQDRLVEMGAIPRGTYQSHVQQERIVTQDPDIDCLYMEVYHSCGECPVIDSCYDLSDEI